MSTEQEDLLDNISRDYKNGFADGYDQGRADAIEPIMSGYPDFKALESLMIEYFERVDLTSEKTDMERLALEIVTRGMQTLGYLNGELEQLKEQKNG